MVDRIFRNVCFLPFVVAAISFGACEKQVASEERKSAATPTAQNAVTSDNAAGTGDRRDLYITNVASAEATIGGRKVSAVITREQPGNVPVGAYDDANGCPFGDTLILRVHRDETLVDTLTYCSAYGMGAVDLQADARGHAFLLLTSAEGHWSLPVRASVTVYSITGELTQVGGFVTQEPIDNGIAATWKYEVATPAAGGLKVNLTAETWPDEPHCCEILEKAYSVNVSARPQAVSSN